MLIKRPFISAIVLCVALPSIQAGSEGISPLNGTYSQNRTDPPPAAHVADTRFTSQGGNNYGSPAPLVEAQGC